MTPSTPNDLSADTHPSTRVPHPQPAPELTTDAMERFACIGGACSDTCCRDWAVPLTRQDLGVMKATLSSTAVDRRGDLVHLVTVGRPSRHGNGVAHLQMTDQGVCSLLDPDNRCSVHASLGEQALTTSCSVFPRTALAVAGHVEVGGSLACPEVARLMLLPDQHLALRPATKPMLPRQYVGKTITPDVDDAFALHFLPVREALLDCFRRQQSLATQLVVAADLAERLQAFFHGGTREFDGAHRPLAERRLEKELADTRVPALHEALDRDLALLQVPGDAVTGLISTLLFERRRLPHGSRYGALLEGVAQSVAAELPGQDGRTPAALWQVYARRRTRVAARIGRGNERLFSRYCQHFLMRNPFTDSATLLEHLYRLGVHLAAVRFLTTLHPELRARFDVPDDTGAEIDTDQAAFDRIAIDVVQTFTKAIGHHPEYLETVVRQSGSASGGFTFGRIVLLAKFV